MESFVNIVLAVTQLLFPIMVFVWVYFMRKRMKQINRHNEQIMNDYLRHSRETAMAQFLQDNPEIDPEIFEEKKEPIVPSRDNKPRHHFNHKGGDYFM